MPEAISIENLNSCKSNSFETELLKMNNRRIHSINNDSKNYPMKKAIEFFFRLEGVYRIN